MTRWLDNLSLRTKILGALLLIVLIGLISLGWDVMSLTAIDAKTADIAAESDQLIAVQDIQAYTLEEDLDEKNILLTGDTSWLDEHEADRKETDKYIGQAAQNAADPQDQQALTDVVTLRGQYEENWQHVLTAYQSGDESAATDAAFDKSDTQLGDINDKLDGVIVRGQDMVDGLFSEADAQSKNAILFSGVGTLLFLLIGAGVFVAVSRTVRAIQLVTRAAAAVEAGNYGEINLGALPDRRDDVGQLARVFKRMTDEIYAREQKLTAQVDELHIQIDLVRQDKQVQEIVDSDFFKDLQARARNIRAERQKSGGAAGKPAEG